MEYFCQKGWEEDWIETAEKLVRDVYTTYYEGKEGPATATATANAEPVSILIAIFDVDANQISDRLTMTSACSRTSP